MTAIPHRTPPIHPTSSEYAMQAIALERGGKPAEVLVKAARDLVIAHAVAQAGGQRDWLITAAARFAGHARAAGEEVAAELDQQAGHAARILGRYIP